MHLFLSQLFLAFNSAAVICETACFMLVEPASPALSSACRENMKKRESGPADLRAVLAAI